MRRNVGAANGSTDDGARHAAPSAVAPAARIVTPPPAVVRPPTHRVRTAAVWIGLAAVLLGLSAGAQAARGALRPAKHSATAVTITVTVPAPPATPPTTPTSSTTPHASPPLGVPVRIIVASHQLTADISAHPFVNQAVYVPSDPQDVSWTDGEKFAAAPYAPAGTILLTSHINFIIDGQDVAGAFWDLADYKVGQTVLLAMRDGRTASYRVARAPVLKHKGWLAEHPQFWAQLLDPSKTYGFTGGPRGARLVLVSCGGNLEEIQTPNGPVGDYQSNVFVELWPTS